MFANFNARVLFKEPRGFLRLWQILLSWIAWSTTSQFSTVSILKIFCPGDDRPYEVRYKIQYPFDLTQEEAASPIGCTDDTNIEPKKFDIDFSVTAMLYTLVAGLSFCYAIGAVIYYSFYTAKYETNPLAPMVDLNFSLLFTLLWLIMTCTWALNITDLKHYTHANYFKDHLPICQDDRANCDPGNPGKWTSATVSIVCGFACALLWLGSTWSVFKETTLHKGRQQQQQQQQQGIVQENQPQATGQPF